MQLRPYQQAAVDAVLKAWREGKRRVLVVMPTGTGKTVVFAAVAKAMLESGRVMVLAHRGELVWQARQKLLAMTGADCQVEMAEFTSENWFGKPPPIIVSTVQTQSRGRMRRFDPKEFSALIVDECHHAPAETYRACISHYAANPDLGILGVTATPDRADEVGLKGVFEHVAYEYTVSDAIRDGYLVGIREEMVRVDKLDFSRVSTQMGDFNQAELAEVMEEEDVLHRIAAPTLEICRDKRAIVFCCSVKQSEALAGIFRRTPGINADYVCGAMPREERERKLKAFREGKVQFLCNCGVLTEGFDDAGVEAVVMARPTQSRALYAQMVGRGTRPAAAVADRLGLAADAGERRALIAGSAKPSCLVVDFVGNSGRHSLASACDILAGKGDDGEVVGKARELVEKRKVSVEAALDEARAAVRERRELEEVRRRFIVATAKYVKIEVDPFNKYGLQNVVELPHYAGRKFSLRQEGILRDRLKVDPKGITYAMGKAMLDEHFARMGLGLATMPQQLVLRKFGIPVAMSRDEAGRSLDRVFKRRRGHGRVA